MKNTKSLTYLLSVLALASAVFSTDADHGARAGPAASASASAAAGGPEAAFDRVYYMPTYGEAPKFDTEVASIPTPDYPTPTLLWYSLLRHPSSEHPANKPLGRAYLELCRAPRAPKGTGELFTYGLRVTPSKLSPLNLNIG